MRCAMSSTSKQNSALAALRRVPRPIFAVLAVLALGLGVNTAMFTLSYLEFDGLYPRPDELVVLRSKMQRHENGISTGDFVNWRKQATVFKDLNASTEGSFRVTTPDGMENVAASLVTLCVRRRMASDAH